MSDSQSLNFKPSVIGYPLLFVMAIWIVFWIESRFSLNFNSFGIYPRKVEGLRGILFGPLIHGSLKHIFNNSVPLFVLSTALFYFYRPIRWKVMLYGLLLTGILTWFIGRPSFHIGASGIVYMLAAFLFFKGIFSKQYQLTAISLIVVFLYGGLLWYVFPVNPDISWEGHLSGFFVGFFFSLVFKGHTVENKKYDWEREDFKPEEDAFLKQFDENGNFIEIKKELPAEKEAPKEGPSRIKIVYNVKRPNENRE